MPTRPKPVLLASLFAFVAPLATLAQTGPCGVGNARNWCAGQDSPGVAGAAQAGDRFGAALAFGDFDGDGDQDLAVSAPGESDGAAGSAGAVWVFYDRGLGLAASGGELFDQNDLPGDDGDTETGDEFGFALAAGDLDDDGFDDLAIGTPYENQPEPNGSCGLDLSCDNVGHVDVVFGSAAGLDLGRVVTLARGGAEGSGFGYSVAVGDVDGDDDAELLIGDPGSLAQSLGGTIRRGSVSVLEYSDGELFLGHAAGGSDPVNEQDAQWGSAVATGKFGAGEENGLVVAAHRASAGGAGESGRVTLLDGEDGAVLGQLFQTDFGSAGNGAGDRFGTALAVGDFDGDGFDDVASSAPEKDDSSVENSGRVYVAYGSAGGVDADTFQLLRIATFPGGAPAAGDRFGSALAAGDFDGDGFDDLFLGAPGRGNDDRGFVYFVHGGPGGLSAGSGFVFSEPSLIGVAEAGAAFGSVLALGDLDGDGVDEVAIGVPAKDAGASNAGLVYVTRTFDPHWIFGDGLESGGSSNWSSAVP